MPWSSSDFDDTPLMRRQAELFEQLGIGEITHQEYYEAIELMFPVCPVCKTPPDAWAWAEMVAEAALAGDDDAARFLPGVISHALELEAWWADRRAAI